MAKGSGVSGLTVDETNLYAAGSLMGTLGIYAIPLDGSPPALLVNGRYPSDPHGLAVAAGTLYWSWSGDGVYSAPTGGGAFSVFSPSGGGKLAVFDGTLYFNATTCTPGMGCTVNDCTLMAAPISGGPPRVLLAPCADGRGLAADAQGVYLTTNGPSYAPSAAVLSVPLDGGSASTIWSSNGMVGDITVTPYGVAWIAAQNLDSGSGDVSIFSLSEGNVSTLAPSILSGDLSPGLTLAADDSSLYWSSSTVRRVSAGSGPVEQTVSPGSGMIVVDARSIYWIAQAPEVGTQIMRLAK